MNINIHGNSLLFFYQTSLIKENHCTTDPRIKFQVENYLNQRKYDLYYQDPPK